MALVKCKECGEQVSTKAKVCPKCGAPAPKKTSLVTWLVLIFFFVMVYSATQTTTAPVRNSSSKSSTSQSNKPEKVKPPVALWRHFKSKDEMTGEAQSFAASSSVSSKKRMDFPYQDTQAWIGVGCDADSEWAYFGFTNAPNLDDTEIEDGYNRVQTRIKWDEKLEKIKLTQKWGAEVLHFSNDQSAIANLAASNSVLLELKWHSQEQVYFEFPMQGSSAAIRAIRDECLQY